MAQDRRGTRSTKRPSGKAAPRVAPAPAPAQAAKEPGEGRKRGLGALGKLAWEPRAEGRPMALFLGTSGRAATAAAAERALPAAGLAPVSAALPTEALTYLHDELSALIALCSEPDPDLDKT